MCTTLSEGEGGFGAWGAALVADKKMAEELKNAGALQEKESGP
jgi:hypothetical protein